jgi:hypothetical protein
VSVSLLVACSSQPGAPDGDPLANVRDNTLSIRNRVASVEPARARAGTQMQMVVATVRTFKDIAWSPAQPPELRLAVITALLNDPDPVVVEDARAMGKLMLPREQDRPIVVLLAKTAAQRQWTDYIPSLIRSYSRPLPAVEELQRSEALAISDLSAGRPVPEVVFEVFLNPPQMPESYGLDWAKRFRADAWDLLGRLDKDGALRIRLLHDAPSGTGENMVGSNLKRCLAELRSIPLTGDEMNWLNSLLDPAKGGNAEWWKHASAAISRVQDKGPFQIRHAEPVRWAAANKPEWFNASRDELLSQVRSRLDGRTHTDRNSGAMTKIREDFQHYEGQLRWADLICVLVIDEMLHQPHVQRTIFDQTILDAKDKTTEYGGILTFTSHSGTDPMTSAKAGLFPPRPGQRQGDERFVASDEMINASDQSVAHYHFHVQQRRNAGYAGPSDSDLVYAARYGRSCVVFTSLDEGRLNVDFYQPDGIVLDLGEISR